MKHTYKKKFNKKTKTRRRKGGSGNIQSDLDKVKNRLYKQFTMNFSLPIFTSIVLNFMGEYPFYNRSGEYNCGPYFKDYINNNTLDYTPISNFIKDFNQVLNETKQTNITYINPNYFKIENQINLVSYLYNNQYTEYQDEIDYYINCLNGTDMINHEIYDIILDQDISYHQDIFVIPGSHLREYPDGNDKFKYYLQNKIIKSEYPDMTMGNDFSYYHSDIEEIFNIDPSILDEAFGNYTHYMELKIGKDAFYKYMIKNVSNKKTPYLPPELQRIVKGYL